MEQRILVTGAGGRVGRLLRARLGRPGRRLRLVDVGGQRSPDPGEAVELLTGDICDASFMSRACAGATAIVHLGGLRSEDSWENLVRVNVDGTRTVLEAARSGGVPRVLLASSAHAVGFYRRPGTQPQPLGTPGSIGADGLPASVPARPDSLYGVTKATVEALGSLYADRFGMTVITLRLGDCTPEPAGEWALPSWLSPDDCVRLVEACLAADVTGYRVVWGISRNARRWWSLVDGEILGYRPQDDSEPYAEKIPAADGVRAATLGLAGGRLATVPLGVPRQRAG